MKTRKHYFILSCQASTQRNLLNLNLFLPPSWRRPRSRLPPANPRSLYRRVQGILRSLIVFQENNRDLTVKKLNLHVNAIITFKEHMSKKADTTHLQSSMQNICFLTSIFAVILKFMVQIPSIFL